MKPQSIVMKSLDHRYRSYQGFSCYLLLRCGPQDVTYVIDAIELRDHLWSAETWAFLSAPGVQVVSIGHIQFLKDINVKVTVIERGEEAPPSAFDFDYRVRMNVGIELVARI